MDTFNIKYPLFDVIYNDELIPNSIELTLDDAKYDVAYMVIRLVHYYALMQKERKTIDPECDALINDLKKVFIDYEDKASIYDHYKALYNALIRPEFSFIFDISIKHAASLCKNITLVTQNDMQTLKNMVGDIIKVKPLRVKDINDSLEVVSVVRTILIAIIKPSAYMHRIECKGYQLHAAESMSLVNALKREIRKQPSEAIQSVVTLLEPVMKEILTLTAPTNTSNRFAAICRLRDIQEQLNKDIYKIKPLEKDDKHTADTFYKIVSNVLQHT